MAALYNVIKTRNKCITPEKSKILSRRSLSMGKNV